MADVIYKRLDKDQLDYLVLYLLTKLKSSPLAANDNTTYELTQDATDGHKITLKPSVGDPITITIPDNNTEYAEATETTAGLMSAADKKTLSGLISTGGEANVLESVQINGAALTITDKAVNITFATGTDNGTIKVNGTDIPVAGLKSGAYADAVTVDETLSDTSANPVQNKAVQAALAGKADTSAIPTVPKNVSDFNNDSNYQTATEVETAINAKLASYNSVTYSFVDSFESLPVTGADATFYFVPHSHSDENDSYDEYVWNKTAGKYEKIGNTDVNLDGYVKADQMQVMTNDEIAAAVDTAYTSVFGATT